MGKIIAVASSGGHLDQLLYFVHKLEKENKVIVATFKKPDSESRLTHYKHYWLHFPTNRHLLNNLRNLLIAFKLQHRHRPTGYLSTGAASAVVFSIVAKIYKVPCLYIEPIDRIKLPTLTAKILVKLGITIQVYWDTQLTSYSNRRY
jgi:UDP-N-acetylglucosamine:LPS N-acetylglucosamine transferase